MRPVAVAVWLNVCAPLFVFADPTVLAFLDRIVGFLGGFVAMSCFFPGGYLRPAAVTAWLDVCDPFFIVDLSFWTVLAFFVSMVWFLGSLTACFFLGGALRPVAVAAWLDVCAPFFVVDLSFLAVLAFFVSIVWFLGAVDTIF